MTTINKPTKPSSTLPTTWGGTKTAYTQSQINSGYSESVPTVIDGGNVNFEKQGIFERIEYLTKIADVIRNIPADMYLIVNSAGKFEYVPYIKEFDEIFGGYAGDTTDNERFGGNAGDGVEDELLGFSLT